MINLLYPQIINSSQLRNFLGANVDKSYISFLSKISSMGLSIVGLATDLVSEETYSWQNTITQYTLENGVNMSDHIINGYLSIAQTFTIFNVPNFKNSTVLASTMLLALMELRKSKELITLRTSIGSYDNMAIENLTCARMGKAGTTLSVKIKFREMVFADTTTNKVKTVNPTTNKKVNSSNKAFTAAAQPVKQMGPVPTKQRKSLLANAVDSAISIFR